MCHRTLQEATGSFRRLQEATGGHRRPLDATGGHRRPQEATGRHRRPFTERSPRLRSVDLATELRAEKLRSRTVHILRFRVFVIRSGGVPILRFRVIVILLAPQLLQAALERCACLGAPRVALADCATAMDVPDPKHTIAAPCLQAPRKPEPKQPNAGSGLRV